MDILVIGGGAAGFFGAVQCAGALEVPARIRILEKGRRVLEKVRISGGGRCNVTHACFDPAELVANYPRGERALIGPFHQWQPEDVVAWFESRGVTLKTEEDGRIFPTTDNSETIIDCLTGEARRLGVEWETGITVKRIEPREGGGFTVETSSEVIGADLILMATGGTRSAESRTPAERLGHTLEPATPSLFTFHIDDPRLTGLQGLSVPGAGVGVVDAGLSATGPVLVTHWGLSGPAILRLSAWGARELAARDFRFEIEVNWLGNTTRDEARQVIEQQRREHGARGIRSRSPFEGIPKRLWNRWADAASLPETATWSKLARTQEQGLLDEALRARYRVTGKSMNKDEFVTCGGVRLKEIDFRTMESRLHPGLFFAGELLDIDGITGGFNFQAAWTTGYLAGTAMAARTGKEVHELS